MRYPQTSSDVIGREVGNAGMRVTYSVISSTIVNIGGSHRIIMGHSSFRIGSIRKEVSGIASIACIVGLGIIQGVTGERRASRREV